MFFLLRARPPLLIEKIGIRKHHRGRLPRAQFLPLVTPDFPGRGKLHLGSLRGVGGSIHGFEFGLDDTAAVGLIDGKCLGSHAMAILEYAEGTGIDVLTLVFLLFVFLFGQGSGQGRDAPSQRHHENEQPIRQLHCDSPVPKLSGVARGEAAASFLSRNSNLRSISTQREAGSFPEVTTVMVACR